MNNKKKHIVEETIKFGGLMYEQFVTQGDMGAYQVYCGAVDNLSKLTGLDTVQCARKIMMAQGFGVGKIKFSEKSVDK